MEQSDVRAEQAKRAGEYEQARTDLQHLIDNPEKHLPVSEYRDHLNAAKKAVARAYKALQATRA